MVCHWPQSQEGVVSISQVIGCENRLRNDLHCVEWGVKLYSNQPQEGDLALTLEVTLTISLLILTLIIVNLTPFPPRSCIMA